MDCDRIADLPEVALAEMNAVHRQEIRLLREFVETLEACRHGNESRDALDPLLGALLDHLAAHFRGEEARMEAAAFPPYPVHKAEHDRVLAEARAVAEAWLRYRDFDALRRYFCEVLPAWMYNHVATMDRVTAAYLAQRESQA